MKKALSIFLLFNCALIITAQSLLQSGPMLGYSDFQEVAIWVQTKEAAEIQIKYWEIDKPEEEFYTATYSTIAIEAFATTLIANKVEPGKTYNYQLLLNTIPIELGYKTEFQTQALWQWRSDPPTFSFATGSCAYINQEEHDRPGEPYGSDYEIFTAINNSNPDFMIWLGDNTYLREPDWNTWTGITSRYTHTRSLPELQPLLASTHHYAIWDDHDYGPNDSDRGWWNKNQTLKAFELFWANPSYGIDNIRGAITQFQWYDVDFILLDNRFYRSPNNLKAENKTILGEEQKQWLKDALTYSTSSFKVVAMGGQFLNDAGTFELYSNNGFNEERQEIIDFIYDQNIKNVVFITGDRHHTELSILEKDGNPKIVDLTVSAFTSGVSKNENENNTLRADNSFTNKHNYGVITFSGKLEDREMHVKICDKNSDLIWERIFQIEN